MGTGRQSSKTLRFAVVSGMILGATTATIAFLGVNSWSGWSPGAMLTLVGSTLPGAIAGVAIGAIVWLMRPRQQVRVLRLLAIRGLVGACTAVLTLALLGGAWGLVHGILPPFGPGDPGVESALAGAVFVILLMGLPAALLGFVVGASTAILIGPIGPDR